MADKEVMKMLRDELASKVDGETLKKLKGAKTKEEGLAILEAASIELDDEVLALIPGGDGLQSITGWCHGFGCSKHLCPKDYYCDNEFWPGA